MARPRGNYLSPHSVRALKLMCADVGYAPAFAVIEQAMQAREYGKVLQLCGLFREFAFSERQVVMPLDGPRDSAHV